MSRRRTPDDPLQAINLDKLPGILHPELTKQAAERQFAEEHPHVPGAEPRDQPGEDREPDDVLCPTCCGRGRVPRTEVEPSLGALLGQARFRTGLTQAEVAAALGLSQAMISRLERDRDGRGRQRAEQLLRYAAHVEVDIPAAERARLERDAAPPPQQAKPLPRMPGRKPRDPAKQAERDRRRLEHADAWQAVARGRELLMLSQRTLCRLIDRLAPPSIPQSRLCKLERGWLWEPGELGRIQRVLDHLAAQRGGWPVVEEKFRPDWRSQAWRRKAQPVDS